MTQYRRSLIHGGTFFLTVTLADRSSDLLVRHIDLLRGAVRSLIKVHPFASVAWVVLPEHLHPREHIACLRDGGGAGYLDVTQSDN